MNIPAALAALDFPTPVQTCDKCEQPAKWRIGLTCECRTLVCTQHAVTLTGAHRTPWLAITCHVHKMHGVRALTMGEIQ